MAAPRRTHVNKTSKPTSWAEDHVAITGIYGIDQRKPLRSVENLAQNSGWKNGDKQI